MKINRWMIAIVFIALLIVTTSAEIGSKSQTAIYLIIAAMFFLGGSQNEKD